MLRILTPAALVLSAGLACAEDGQPGSHFVENWDLDGDGKVTLQEATEKRGDIFYMFDSDENGMLDGAEYDLFDETRKADMEANAGGHRKGAMKNVNRGMLRETTDVNGDGQVSRDEFLETVPDWFRQVDRNGDGAVTPDDFGGGQGG